MVNRDEDVDVHNTLPVGTYTVKYDEMHGFFYLEIIEDFETTGKIYGDTLSMVARILTTFHSRDNATGIMLSGEKGSGKTLLAKLLSIQAAKENGIPTIVINQPWAGEEFNSFIQKIEQPAIIIFDEFEKVYDSKEQEKMLTLLDGVYPSKKMFIITCNDKWRVSDHMRNRPGRIYYRIDYTGLTQEFIIEYCEDNLEDKSHIDAMCKVAALFGEFNFDMLKAMVEEMNRYDESPHDVMKLVNAKPELSDRTSFELNLQMKDVGNIDKSKLETSTWNGNPLVHHIEVMFRAKDKWHEVNFAPADLEGIDPRSGRFQYENHKGDKLTLTRKREREYDWRTL